MATIRAAAVALFVSAAASASAATYTVTSSAASGPGTLRQAIIDANANPGGDAIRFTVAQATIEPSGLPPITDQVDIDGLLGDGSRVLIEMPGALDVVGGFRFHLGSGMSTLRNIVTGPIPNAALEIAVDVNPTSSSRTIASAATSRPWACRASSRRTHSPLPRSSCTSQAPTTGSFGTACRW